MTVMTVCVCVRREKVRDRGIAITHFEVGKLEGRNVKDKKTKRKKVKKAAHFSWVSKLYTCTSKVNLLSVLFSMIISTHVKCLCVPL